MNSKKTVIVSGATKGLGKVIAKDLLDAGYKVIGTGRATEAPSNYFKEENSHYYSLDLKELDSFHAFITAVKKAHGPIYGLINNAAQGKDGVLATMHDSDIIQQVNVNLTATMLLSKYASRAMLAQKCGRIISISSIIANSGFRGLSVYGATKSALNGFTRSLSRELAPVGITVNTVSPGYIETEMTSDISKESAEKILRRSPMNSFVDPLSVSSLVRFLLSAEAKHINGADHIVDTGSSV